VRIAAAPSHRSATPAAAALPSMTGQRHGAPDAIPSAFSRTAAAAPRSSGLRISRLERPVLKVHEKGVGGTARRWIAGARAGAG
jgi:hypothetical protein